LNGSRRCWPNPIKPHNEKKAFGLEKLGDEVKEHGANLLIYSSIYSLLNENVSPDLLPQNLELSVYISSDIVIDLIAAFITYDPYNEWGIAVSNIIENVLDLFPGSFTFVGISDLRLKSGFRRPSSNKKHNYYFIFEVVISIDAEASAWELLDLEIPMSHLMMFLNTFGISLG